MALTIKYYQLTDPITGGATKDVGWEQEITFTSISSKTVGGITTVKRLEEVTQTNKISPEMGVEITKNQYDNLDVSNESLTYRQQRENNLLRLEKLQAKVDNIRKPKNKVEVLDKVSEERTEVPEEVQVLIDKLKERHKNK